MGTLLPGEQFGGGFLEAPARLDLRTNGVDPRGGNGLDALLADVGSLGLYDGFLVQSLPLWYAGYQHAIATYLTGGHPSPDRHKPVYFTSSQNG
jgi:hypothetical protein